MGNHLGAFFYVFLHTAHPLRGGKINDTILINELRFGKIIGCYDINERFAFYFYLQPDADNALAVQRGRFAKWDEGVFEALIKRIKGN